MYFEIPELIKATCALWEDMHIDYETKIQKVVPAVDGIIFVDVDGTDYKWHRASEKFSIYHAGDWRKK